MPKWVENIVNMLFIIGVIFGSAVSSLGFSWDLGDMFLGICVWINMIFLIISAPVAVKLLKDYEKKKHMGLDPVFNIDEFKGQRGFKCDESLWRKIRDGFNSGSLKN